MGVGMANSRNGSLPPVCCRLLERKRRLANLQEVIWTQVDNLGDRHLRSQMGTPLPTLF